MNRISIIRQEETLAACEAENEALLYFHGEYQPGDTIVFENDTHYVIAGIDHTVSPARLYLPEKTFIFRLPLEGDLPRMYPPFAFQGDRHLITLIEDTGNEYRNLARNPADQRHDSGAYPHASANVETRDESIFFARNVIDGEHIAHAHGYWPFLSWGIGGRADAAIKLDFGREVSVDKAVLYLRADFKHSGYWKSATLHLSDGYEKTVSLKEFDGSQEIPLGDFHTITWVSLNTLIPADNCPSPYQSLRQFEVYGRDIM
ncbi:MAG: carbohydrate-binding protein [Clostridiales bacterium]|nr:carbohydrate-binding protein [Clostridiales bacterium]